MHALVPLGVVRLRVCVRLLLLLLLVVVAAEAGRRRGLGEADGRVPELSRGGMGRGLEGAVLVLVGLLALQVRRRRRREVAGGVGRLAVGLRVLASSHGLVDLDARGVRAAVDRKAVGSRKRLFFSFLRKEET